MELVKVLYNVMLHIVESLFFSVEKSACKSVGPQNCQGGGVQIYTTKLRKNTYSGIGHIPIFSNFVSKNNHEPIELVSTDTFWVTLGYTPPPYAP